MSMPSLPRWCSARPCAPSQALFSSRGSLTIPWIEPTDQLIPGRSTESFGGRPPRQGQPCPFRGLALGQAWAEVGEETLARERLAAATERPPPSGHCDAACPPPSNAPPLRLGRRDLGRHLLLPGSRLHPKIFTFLPARCSDIRSVLLCPKTPCLVVGCLSVRRSLRIFHLEQERY